MHGTSRNLSRWAALLVAALPLPFIGGSSEAKAIDDRSPKHDSRATQLSQNGCAPGFLPDGALCLRIPDLEDADFPEAQLQANTHRDRSGRWTTYDQIPRRPDRPASYDSYRYPIPTIANAGARVIMSGYDLDKPDNEQRRGRTLTHVGHGGVDLPQTRGTPVRVVNLEHQRGDADVVFLQEIFGTTVITHHVIHEGGQLHDYIVLYGHLDSISPALKVGMPLRDEDLVGSVGDTGSPGLVHLHFEVRRVRDGVDVEKTARAGGAGLLFAEWISVVCDPRNILPILR